MRVLSVMGLMLASVMAYASDYQRLWDAAGWPQQRAHFAHALNEAQQRYQNSLPSAIYQSLLTNSNQRFASPDLEARAQKALSGNLKDPQPALSFFESALGRKIIAAETQATTALELAKNADGIPALEASATRRLLIRHLAQALPATEAAAEVSLALAGMAADSLTQMLPGLVDASQSQALLDSQRQRLIEQADKDIDATLLYVYRSLSDAELESFVEFAQSADGQAYYQAAVQTLRAALRPN